MFWQEQQVKSDHLLCKPVKITLVVRDFGVVSVYKLLHSAWKEHKREDIWSKARVMVCLVYNNSHTYTFIHTHMDNAESCQKGYLIGVKPGRGDVPSERIHTLPALEHKRAEQQYYGVHWVPVPPVKTFQWEWAWPTSPLV